MSRLLLVMRMPLLLVGSSDPMAQVTTDSKGNVVIQCTIAEAAVLELAAALYDGPSNETLLLVWDRLDDFIKEITMKHPTLIPLITRQERAEAIFK
jgi:hypothetical protein